MSTVAIIFYIVVSGHMVTAPFPPQQNNIAKFDCNTHALYFNEAEIKDAQGHIVYAYCLIDEPDMEN
jgi:hypothetical protein